MGSIEEQKRDADEQIFGLWNDVIRTVNRLLEADDKFGFKSIEASLHPSITEIVHGLAIVDLILNTLLDSNLIDHDQTRLALNSKQWILHIRRLATALSSGDEDEYEQTVRLLHSQAQV